MSRRPLLVTVVALTATYAFAQSSPTLYGTPQTASYAYQDDSPATTLTVNLPDGGIPVSADTLYIVEVASRNGEMAYNPGLTAPSGFAQLCSVLQGTYNLEQVYYQIYPAGSTPPPSATFTSPDDMGETGLIAFAYQGMSTANPFDGACMNGTGNAGSSSVGAPSIMTTLPNDTAVWTYFVAGDVGTTQPAVTEGTVEGQVTRSQFDAEGYMAVADLAEPSPNGAGTNTLTWYPNQYQYNTGAAGVAFAIAASGSGTPTPQAYASDSQAPFTSLVKNAGGDIINLANLDVMFNVPIMQKNGRGMPFGYLYSYDGAVYANNGTSWQPTSSSWGWLPELTVSSGYLTYQTSTVVCGSGQNQDSTLQFTNWAFVDSQGVSHPFSFATPPENGNGVCDIDPTNASGSASDGSGYYLVVDGNVDTDMLPTATVTAPNGRSLQPPMEGPTGPGVTEDTNGNTIVSNTIGVFTDTTGAQALTQGGGLLTWPSPAGGTDQSQVTYSTFTIRTNFGCPGVAEFTATNIELPTSISLPNGTNWSFTYETTPGYSGDVTGRIASITLPTGGTITYTYTGDNNGIECADGSPAGLIRESPDGTVSYGRAQSGTYSQTTETDPFGNQTVIDFQGLYETQRQVYNGSATGTPLETISTCYDGASAPCTTTAVSAPVSERAIVTTTDTGLVSERDEYYGDSADTSLLTELDEFAFGNGSRGPLLRKTVTTYNSTLQQANIFDHPSEVKVTDGNGNTVSDTTYQYDTGTLETSGYANPYSGARGNLTVVSQWISGSTWATTNIAYYDDGEVYTTTDPNGNTTTFGYNSNSCSGAFPTSVSLPQGLSTGATWNCVAGLPASSTDANGNSTTYTYDGMGRSLQTSSPGTSAGPRVVVVGHFDHQEPQEPPPTVETYTSTTDDGTSNYDLLTYLHTTTDLDWAGRQQAFDLYGTTGGISTQATTYDGLGRPASQTNPYFSTSDPTYGVTTTAYDALNRVISVTNQDNSVAHTYYGANVSANGGLSAPQCSGLLAYPVEKVSAAGRLSQTWIDADGHVVEADEPNPTTGSLTSGEQVTCYGYTAAGMLAWVHQDVQAQTTQERALAYDGLGRVLYSRYPEATANISGPTVDGSSNWSEAITYDANGNPTTRTDANGATATLTYDGLNRPTAESFSGGATTPSLSYYYDSTSGCTVPNGATPANLAGRLACAVSSNGTYTLYGYDPAGDITDVWDQAPDVLSHQGYGYFFNGQLASYTNPEGDTFTYSINVAAQLTQVVAGSSWNGGETVLSQPTYDAAGALANASLGNSSMSVTRNINNRLEPIEITAAVSGTTQFDRLYGFDADALPTSLTDNVNSAYDQTYAYDSLGRLTGMTATNNSSASATYSYDAYGNLFNASGPENWAATFNPQTNRISDSGFTYDNDGELTGDGSNSYTWNDAGQMTAADNTTLYFDALGRRVKSVTSSESDDYIYNLDGSLAAVYNATAGSWKTFEFSINGTPVETKDVTPPSGYSNYTYSVTDIVRSPALRVNSTAGSNTYTYMPYGYDWPGQSSDPTTNIGFTGDESEPGNDLYHTLARDYAPFEKRWLTPDPAGWAVASPASPQSWDRYSYVDANPLGATDPTGFILENFGGCTYDAVDYYVNDQYQGTDYYLLSCQAPNQSGGAGGVSNAGGWGPTAPQQPQVVRSPTTIGPSEQCTTGYGIGVTAGADAVAGLGYGAGGNVGAGLGVFGGNGINGGALASGGAAASAFGHAISAPAANLIGRFFAGLVAGAGVGIFVTNASQASQLGGLSGTWNVDFGAILNGAAQFSAGRDSAGNNIWSFSFTLGLGLGAGYHNITNNTVTAGTKGGCR